MIHSTPSADVTEAERFERLGLHAHPAAVAQTREQFSRWLQDYFDVDQTRSSDMVLALNEALANAAEFAYLHAEHPGTVDVQARYQPDGELLAVRVSDRGVWRVHDEGPRPLNRGRGIPLMRALSDRAVIETSATGTNVSLEWTGVTQR